ncbi:annexin-B12-like [Centruroides sculpturatus]|uniref:annexin-B12-like n=1 Tax=Centruroides sculpturatus TaxID=218467 RepID=UPI000C6CB982|nr:annexin-B12-like [Centruroides sculpturatus]
MEALKGTITHAESLAAEKVAASLRHALRGINTDDQTIIEVLTKHSSCQRQEISEKYTNIYGRNLIDDIKAVLGGHFEDVCVALLKPIDEVLVDHLYDACKKKDKYCVFHVLCCHDSEELESLKALFIIKYNVEPETYICESFTGDIRRLLEMLVARADKEVNEDLAEIEGQQLYDQPKMKSLTIFNVVFLHVRLDIIPSLMARCSDLVKDVV